MGTQKRNRKARKKLRGVDNKRLESMRAQKMDNDSEVYSEWPAQQQVEIKETICSIETGKKIQQHPPDAVC